MEGGVIIGSTININRSDGRVHPAVVVAVNKESKFVRVEWVENDEVKGKDMELRVAELLNPDVKFMDKIGTKSPESVKRNADDFPVNKIQRRAIPIGNRRTNIGIKRLVSENINELSPLTENVSKVYQTRSQCKYVGDNNVGSKVRESIKIDRVKSDKRPKPFSNVNLAAKRTQKDPSKQLSHMIDEFRATITFDSLAIDDVVEDHLITVCVRKRPLNKFELTKKEVDIVSVTNKNNLLVHEPKTKVDLTKYLDNHQFRFDYAFDEKCNNALVYKYTAQPLVKTLFDGGFATCFAYGQTGSGKTYTMSGDSSRNDVGIYVLAISDVFKMINSSKYAHLNLSVSCSFFEIYSGKVLDLLNSKSNLKILEDGKQQVQVVGLKEHYVTNTNEVLNLINKGDILRTSGQTSANSNSSRSHAVFQIYLRNNGSIYGKLSLIDLAGNERGADTFSSDRQTRLEGGEINKSLLALKECIRALGRKGAHLPFRVSKLTQVLRDSFVGSNSRTCMIAMLSPGVNSCENTLNTLRYADRVKELGTNDHTTETATLVNEKIEIQEPIQSTSDLTESPRECAKLQYAENKLFNVHRTILTKLQEIEKEGQNLMKTTKSYDYNRKNYVDKFEHLIDDAISNLLITKESIDDFKEQLLKI